MESKLQGLHGVRIMLQASHTLPLVDQLPMVHGDMEPGLVQLLGDMVHGLVQLPGVLMVHGLLPLL